MAERKLLLKFCKIYLQDCTSENDRVNLKLFINVGRQNLSSEICRKSSDRTSELQSAGEHFCAS